MIAYDPAGITLVLADGDELLVHDGPSEGPRWRCTLPAPLVAIGATADAVIAVDRHGALSWYDPHREQTRSVVQVGAQVVAAAVASDGRVLVASDAGVGVFGPRGREHALVWPDARLVAWAPGGRALVGDEAGKLGEFDASGGLVRSVQLEAPAVAAAWNPQGFWVVATASKLLRVVDGQVHHLTNSPDTVVRAVACSSEGAAIGMLLGDALVLVLSWPGRDTIGQIRYLDRSATGLAFGPAPWLAVGLDGGDGNKFDLATGNLNRTDTHPGRTHRRWLAKVSVHPPEAAPAAPPTPAAPAPSAYARPEVAPKRSRLPTVIFVMIAAVVALYLFVRY